MPAARGWCFPSRQRATSTGRSDRSFPTPVASKPALRNGETRRFAPRGTGRPLASADVAFGVSSEAQSSAPVIVGCCRDELPRSLLDEK